MKWFALLFLLIPSITLAQDELSDFGEVALDTNESTDVRDGGRQFGGGNGPKTDKNRFVPVWIYVDGVGLSAAAKTRVRNSFKCILTGSPSRLTRLLCRIGQADFAKGKPFKAAATSEWLIYTLLPRGILRHAKWCFGNGTCSQSGRISIIGPRWDTVAGHARCADFFPPLDTLPPVGDDRFYCGVDGSGHSLHAPPVEFKGIDPNLGRP